MTELEIEQNVDLTEIILIDKNGGTRKSITFNNPNGLGIIVIEYDYPISEEDKEFVLTMLPKTFYEKDGKSLGFNNE